MVDEIVCPDCQQVFYDWWDADNHVSHAQPIVSGLAPLVTKRLQALIAALPNSTPSTYRKHRERTANSTSPCPPDPERNRHARA